jgi:hypothetical protein
MRRCLATTGGVTPRSRVGRSFGSYVATDTFLAIGRTFCTFSINASFWKGLAM